MWLYNNVIIHTTGSLPNRNYLLLTTVRHKTASSRSVWLKENLFTFISQKKDNHTMKHSLCSKVEFEFLSQSFQSSHNYFCSYNQMQHYICVWEQWKSVWQHIPIVQYIVSRKQKQAGPIVVGERPGLFMQPILFRVWGFDACSFG